MRIIRFLLIVHLAFQPLFALAQNEPLTVAAPPYYPPFIMQGANNQFFGFDISMMVFICKQIERQCQFKIIDFDKAIDAVSNQQVDVAVGAISINTERAQKVYFSTPYLPTQAQFLGRAQEGSKTFSLTDLANKRIGIEKGSVFDQEIKILGVKNPTIVPYQHKEMMLEALSQQKIDYVLLDAPTSQYWQNHSSGILTALGEPFDYGNGLGIAVNKQDTVLLNQINQALIKYQKSGDFKTNYSLYLEIF